MTAEVLARHVDDRGPKPAHAKWKKVRHLDGSGEIEYEYDSPESDPLLYAHSSLGFEPNLGDARISYAAASSGVSLGFRLGKDSLTLVERNDLWRWGDESRCVLLVREGEKVGNVFATRKGKKVFVALFVGVYFEEPEPIREALATILEQVERYQP